MVKLSVEKILMTGNNQEADNRKKICFSTSATPKI
jgi:hypothetical protein